MVKVLVSFGPNSRQRLIIENLLEDYAKVYYKENFPEDVDILITLDPMRELGENGIRSLKSLKFIQCVYAGVDHIPYESIPENVVIAGNFGAYSAPIAEHVLGMILDLAKNLTLNHIRLSRGIYNRNNYNKVIKGKTVGILGFGGIGKETAKLLRPFDVKILAINRTGKTDFEVDFMGTLKDLDFVLKRSDIFIISIPLTKYTKNLITFRELSMMKTDAILINVARAHIVNEKDLYEHLVNNPNFQAAFDVWWREPFKGEDFSLNYPFFELDNFLGSPHNSNMIEGMFEEALKIAVENVLNFIRGFGVKNIVDRSDYV